MIPTGADRITICHWNEGGRWEAIEIDNNALKGHDNHEMDIWPPVPEVTEGKNWNIGQSVYMNGCSLVAGVEPAPTSSPAPSPSLPTSGAQDVGVVLLVAAVLIAIGIYLLIRRD